MPTRDDIVTAMDGHIAAADVPEYHRRDRGRGERPVIELPELEGLVVAFVVPGDEEALGSWLHVRADGAVIVYCGKVEVGQNVRTSLAQIVAEELRVPADRVSMVMGDTARTPFDIGTFSSLTTRTVGTQLRRVAAVARERLAALDEGIHSLPASASPRP